uniref:vacuolar protein sorting-associated protein 33B isoform X2 n=1 Tax=Myxine glutinosa TaxID=7769 RepID=UPI00358EF5C1
MPGCLSSRLLDLKPQPPGPTHTPVGAGALPGRKDLFIDPALMPLLDRITGSSVLKKHEVDKFFKLDGKHIPGGCEQRFFLIRPEESMVKIVADSLNADKACSFRRKCKIIFTPRKLFCCDTILELEGVYGDVSCEEWECDLVPVYDDVLSMEIPAFFRDFFLEGNQCWLYTVAKSLCKLQSIYGTFGKVYGIGRSAKMVNELMEAFSGDFEDGTNGKGNNWSLFLIDRDVDFVTPLCSQVTFQGLLDDVFTIKCGSVEFGSEVTGSEKNVKINLGSGDKVFAEICDQHFSNVFGFLSSKAKTLQASYDKRHGMDIRNMKDFVANELRMLKQQHRFLSLYIGACEVIMKKKMKGDLKEQLKVEHALFEGTDTKQCISYIEECINRQCPLPEVLRLLCLLSVTEGGLLPNDLRNLKNHLLQSYGTEQLLTLANLRRAGLLADQQPLETMGKLVADKTVGKAVGKLTDAFTALQRKSHFRALSKKINLVPVNDEEFDLKSPSDMAYVFGGAYSPLSCRMIEQVLEKNGWTGLEDVARLLNGSEFSHSKCDVSNVTSSHLVLVFFLGGCSFSEIAALRFLGRSKGYRFVVGTTALTNSPRLLEALMDA